MARDEPTVPLLEAAPDLGGSLDDNGRGTARLVRVRVLRVGVGAWDPRSLSLESAPLGLLVVDGALVRTTELGGRRAVELVSDGDLLWPWDDDSLGQRAPGRGAASAAAANGDLEPPGPAAAAWSVLAPLRVALLDARVAALAGRMPAFAGELVARGARRARALSAQLALSQVPRVDARLHGFLWHLAEHHGRVRPDGVLLPLPLTHELLAGLVGARRPSVTTALGQLSRRGAVSRVPEGWLLGRSP
ncbi:MAG: helix-turn-helix domain-containing protein [Solirubrobacteraceae bacterium MAG38_C4-C5]|nr:helix-turn-helix domain-containing protein [Candidatus Siliceabacter maunaloa]